MRLLMVFAFLFISSASLAKDFDWTNFDKTAQELNDETDKKIQQSLCDRPQPKKEKGSVVLRYERENGKCKGKLK
jgi:hypothetical protein